MHVLVCKHLFIYLCTFPRNLKKMFLTMKIKQIIASLGCESKGNRSSWHELFRKEMVIYVFRGCTAANEEYSLGTLCRIHFMSAQINLIFLLKLHGVILSLFGPV